MREQTSKEEKDKGKAWNGKINWELLKCGLYYAYGNSLNGNGLRQLGLPQSVLGPNIFSAALTVPLLLILMNTLTAVVFPFSYLEL